MRALILIATASVASQLPARDVPHNMQTGARAQLVPAGHAVCPEEAKRAAQPVVQTGPTVFASPGSIA